MLVHNQNSLTRKISLREGCSNMIKGHGMRMCSQGRYSSISKNYCSDRWLYRSRNNKRSRNNSSISLRLSIILNIFTSSCCNNNRKSNNFSISSNRNISSSSRPIRDSYNNNYSCSNSSSISSSNNNNRLYNSSISCTVSLRVLP